MGCASLSSDWCHLIGGESAWRGWGWGTTPLHIRALSPSSARCGSVPRLERVTSAAPWGREGQRPSFDSVVVSEAEEGESTLSSPFALPTCVFSQYPDTCASSASYRSRHQCSVRSLTTSQRLQCTFCTSHQRPSASGSATDCFGSDQLPAGHSPTFSPRKRACFDSDKTQTKVEKS